jgi:hypothetical protein
MLYAIFKAALSGIIVALVSETARRNAFLGALVASLPIVSVLAMMWLWRDTKDAERIASHAEATFWLVLPSLPMFLVLPALLRSGVTFYLALSASCAMTIALYFLMLGALKLFNISF